ncbi:MAG: peptidylprolyl isomerase [Clostridia bacterium]|nr:peptidylprolyl isomerase [Clostridia bacterium]
MEVANKEKIMKNSLRKRGLAGVLVLATLLLVFASCGPSYKKGDTTVLLTVGGIEVTHEQYRFICMKNAIILAGEDQGYYSGPDEEAHLKELEKAVERELRLYYAVETLAKKYGVKLSKDDKDLIKEELQGLRAESKTEEDYYKWLDNAFMSEHVFYLQTRNYYLERNLFYHIIDEQNGILQLSDEQLKKDIDDYFYAAGQILIKKDGEDPQGTLEKVLAALEEGEDFYTLAERYSGDTLKEVRYFTTGEMQAYFEDTVKGLQIGQISAPVESDMGTHIIKREAITKDYIEKNLEAFRDTDLVRIYNEMLAEEAMGLEIVYTEDYTGIIRE